MPVHCSRQSGFGGNQRRLARDARRLLAHLELSSHHLSLLLCDDADIRELNRQYRNKDSATDVLSFPMDGRAGPHLGDLAISTDTARRQGAAAGHGLEAELHVLLVHGLLHLLGHDHHEATEAEQMRSAEARLLAFLGHADPTGLIERAHALD